MRASIFEDQKGGQSGQEHRIMLEVWWSEVRQAFVDPGRTWSSSKSKAPPIKMVQVKTEYIYLLNHFGRCFRETTFPHVQNWNLRLDLHSSLPRSMVRSAQAVSLQMRKQRHRDMGEIDKSLTRRGKVFNSKFEP